MSILVPDGEFRREIQWMPGFDHRNDPEKAKYGCHGLNLRWLLHGPRGTVQFMLYTGWLPTWKSIGEGGSIHQDSFLLLPADYGRHADKPLYEGERQDECDCRPSGKCYYDGSALNAERLFRLLITEGEEAVWNDMKAAYQQWFVNETDAMQIAGPKLL